MSGLLERRGFLRGLVSLPLIGGGVTLVGNPTAAAVVPDEVLIQSYERWLCYEKLAIFVERHGWRRVYGDFHDELQAEIEAGTAPEWRITERATVWNGIWRRCRRRERLSYWLPLASGSYEARRGASQPPRRPLAPVARPQVAGQDEARRFRVARASLPEASFSNPTFSPPDHPGGFFVGAQRRFRSALTRKTPAKPATTAPSASRTKIEKLGAKLLTESMRA